MDTSFYHISEKAVERVANAAVLTVPGVRALDAKLAGLAGRSFPRVDVHLDRTLGIAAIETEIATSYPAPVAAITDAVRATVIAHARTLCGLDVSQVKVTVANVEADADGGRVTWDEVTNHYAAAHPTPIRISPSEVTSPVTKERAPLIPIEARSLLEDLRGVAVPAPPEVEHIEVPEEPTVQTDGFVGDPQPLADIFVPAPRPVRVPVTPEPLPLRAVITPPRREVMPVSVRPTHVRSPQTPAPADITPVFAEPVIVKPVYAAPAKPLAQVDIHSAMRLEPVSLPARKPLKEILTERPQLVPVELPSAEALRSVAPPPPTPVYHPTAPAPAPLKQITIQPVEKYYDRTH